MNQSKIILIAAAVVLIAGAIIACVYYNNQKIIPHDFMQPIIGGQKDSGGCLIAAGYSWCEPKNKCLRLWEEKCYVNEEAALTKIFATEHNQQVTSVTITKLQNNFSSGSISFGPVGSEGGAFLARLVNKDWTIDYEGNGSIDCVKIRALGYPQDVLTGFCDVACTMEAKLCPDGSSVGRSGPNCEFAPCPGDNNNYNYNNNINSVVCGQEEKICPDGTPVSRTGANCEFSDCPEPESVLSEAEARVIAEKSCIKGGEALDSGNYNFNTKTWWFDANLNATREGCNPACVVDEATKTAEINWRCTGLIVPTE